MPTFALKSLINTYISMNDIIEHRHDKYCILCACEKDMCIDHKAHLKHWVDVRIIIERRNIQQNDYEALRREDSKSLVNESEGLTPIIIAISVGAIIAFLAIYLILPMWSRLLR